MPTYSPESSPLSKISRRQALGLGVGIAGMALVGCKSDEKPVSPQQRIVPPDLGTPRPVEHAPDEWNSARVQQEIEAAIKQSLESGKLTTVELPKGEIIVDKKITCVVPKGAQIQLKGSEEGSKLKLDPQLSLLPLESRGFTRDQAWASFAEHTMLEFAEMEGAVQLEGIQFDGGSDHAGKSGYKAPPSPWNSVVYVRGAGEGNKYDPAMNRAGNRNGTLTVDHCAFTNSESGGLLAQNLSSATVTNTVGENLDVLFNSTWCDTVVGQKLAGKNFASDGVYITSAQDVTLSDCSIETARQGYDLQGVKKARLTSCRAYDSGKAFEITSSETDGITPGGDIELNGTYTEGCMEVYSVGAVQKLRTQGGRHYEVGKWFDKYTQGDFLHGAGIVDPGSLAYGAQLIHRYDPIGKTGRPLVSSPDIKFNDEEIHIARGVPPYPSQSVKGVRVFK